MSSPRSASPPELVLDFDIVVIGAGIAGLTVAGACAQRGSRVAVVEVAPTVGGSARMSEGFVWTEGSMESFAEADPEGDTAAFRLILENLEASLEWVESLGVTVGDWQTMFSSGRGRQIDVVEYFSKLSAMVERAGGYIFCNTTTRQLLRDEEGSIVGAVVDRRDQGAIKESATLTARSVILATGGFHANRQLREDFGIPNARNLIIRGNQYNRGGGIQLALEVGASLSPAMTGFYGHAIPYPLERFEEPDFTLLAQYQVAHGLLLNADGERFCDESRGYSPPAMDIASLGRALLVIDERIRQDHVLGALLPGMDQGVDKLQLARERGANVATASSLSAVAEVVASWGYNGERARESVIGFNRAIRSDMGLSPERRRNRNAIDEPPFHAMEVQASITFTYGGVATTPRGRVMRSDSQVIGGLYAVGVDSGNLNVLGYAGGLVRGLVLGRLVANEICSTIQAPFE